MASGKITTVKNDFSGGQIDRTVKRRDDTDLVKSGCLTAQNMRLIAGGGATYRPGRRRLLSWADVAARRPFTVRPTPELEFRLSFSDQAVAIYRANGTLHTTLTGAPWTNARLPTISYAQVEQSVFVCHHEFRPQILKYTPATDIWTREALTFQTDLNDESRQPFFRFAPDGATMQPSSWDEADNPIDVEFSAPTLQPSHVGVRFRYVDREIEITEVIDSTHAKANIIDELPPTQVVPMMGEIVDGYSRGEVVEGLTSGAKGEIVSKNVALGRLTIVLYSNYEGFDRGEYLIGPHGRRKTVYNPDDPPPISDPGAAIRWDEAFMSDVRGWPGRVDYDLQRVVFSDFKQKPEAIVWSEIAYSRAFRITGQPTGGIFELVPNNVRVLAVVPGPDEFVITDRGVYFIPTGESDPLKPGSVAFRLIDSVGAARVAPASMSEGVVFVAEGSSRIMAITATGQASQTYVVRDLTEFHTALIRDPQELAVTKGSPDMPERYVYVRNGDGSMVVGRFDGGRDWVGWTPWDGVGKVRGMSGEGDQLTLLSTYFGAFTLLEAMDTSALLDAETPAGDAGRMTAFAGRTVCVRDENGYQGQFAVSGGGALVDYPGDASEATAGFDFDAQIKPLFANLQSGEADGRRQTRRRVARVAVHVIDSNGFVCMGREIAPYRPQDDAGGPPPLRDRIYRFRKLQRDDDAQAVIKRSWPGRLTVLEATAEVTV